MYEEEIVYQEKHDRDSYAGSEVDLLSFHEKRAGRLILDPV